MTRVTCNRAAEVVEALTARAGPMTLTPLQRGTLINCAISTALQVNEMLQAHAMPPQVAAVLFACSGDALRALGLSDDDAASVVRAAMVDMREATS